MVVIWEGLRMLHRGQEAIWVPLGNHYTEELVIVADVGLCLPLRLQLRTATTVAIKIVTLPSPEVPLCSIVWKMTSGEGG